jgi:hypothetical protein
MQEEQIREALNAHWDASAAGDATRNTIFTMAMLFVTIPSQASEFSGEAICRPCGVIIPASRQFHCQANSRKRESLDRGIHNHLPGTTSLHNKHYGVSRR